MRCFVAVDIDDILKAGILPLQKELAGMADVKLVEPENLHFTLKFLGDIDDRMLAEVKKILRKTTSDFKPFSASVRGMGTFPNINYARVVWLGCPDLFNLQKAVDDSFANMFKKEMEINPHLSLARIRTAQYKDKMNNRHMNVAVSFPCSGAIHMVESKIPPMQAERSSAMHLNDKSSSILNMKIKDFIIRHKNIEVGTVEIKEIKLKGSMLTPKGPIYEDVEVFRL